MEIQLQSIGRIRNITLEDVDRINYIVGDNRSGKSSLLSGIILLDKQFKADSNYGFHSYLKNSPSAQIAGNKKEVRSAFVNSISVFSPFYNQSLTGRSNLDQSLPLEPLGIKEEIGFDGEGSPVPLNRFGFPDRPLAKLSKRDAIRSAASGDKTLSYLGKQIDSIAIDHKKSHFITIDEPEFHLNPKLHYKIHDLLETKVGEHPEFYFFIATHSSYLIAAASKKQANTKVYCLVEGNLVTSTAYWSDSNHRGKHIAQQSRGFKPTECKLLVHDLVGSTLENYFPKIIYCENSLKIFIERLMTKNPGSYEKPLLIPSSNDYETIGKISPAIRIMEELQKNQKGNFNLLGSTAFAIIDKLNATQVNEQILVEKISKRYPNSIIVLSEEEIERSYPQYLLEECTAMMKWSRWDRLTESFNQYLRSNKVEERQRGVEKSKVAEYVGERISVEEFAQNFPKLNSLFKS